MHMINNHKDSRTKILVPTPRQLEWYGREKSVFFHFGINTYTNREWGDGTEDPKCFNPTNLDCRQWLKMTRDAGFTTAILTAKHHDGFCLWPSKYTEYSIKNSPYKNGKGDIVREFVDACSEFGIKAGIYLSPWDRHEPTWGKSEYNDYYVNQIEELFNNYGKIWECWWDGAGSDRADYDFERWVRAVRTYQPDCVIFGSQGATPFVDVRWVGNENGVAGKPCWATVESVALEQEIGAKLNSGAFDGDRFIPAEVDVSIRPGWFYHAEQDDMVRSPENLLKLWFTSVGSNAGLLLNIPPKRDGLIAENDINSIVKFGKMLEEAFSDNLAENAEVSYRLDASKEITDITYKFENKIKFNTFVAEEAIELGHKVQAFKVSARVDGEWETLKKGECIGYKCAEYFDTVETDEVKFSIKKALPSADIKFFGLYMICEEWLAEEKMEFSNENIMRNGTAVIERGEDYFDVNLGGVIPFNKIIFEGDKIAGYELYLFDGTNLQLCKSETNNSENRIVCAFDKSIDWAYRFRIKVTKRKAEIEHLKIEVYNS